MRACSLHDVSGWEPHSTVQSIGFFCIKDSARSSERHQGSKARTMDCFVQGMPYLQRAQRKERDGC